MSIQTLANKVIAPDDPTTAALLSAFRKVLVAVGTVLITVGVSQKVANEVEIIGGATIAVLPTIWGSYVAVRAWWKAHILKTGVVEYAPPVEAQTIIAQAQRGKA